MDWLLFLPLRFTLSQVRIIKNETSPVELRETFWGTANNMVGYVCSLLLIFSYCSLFFLLVY